MGLFGKKEKNTYYSISIVPLKLDLETICSMLSKAFQDAGLTLTKEFMVIRERGVTVGGATINGDIDVSCFVLVVSDYELEVKLKVPSSSTTSESLIAQAFILFFKQYVSMVPGVRKYNYWACKGEKDNDRKMFTWSDVQKVVGNDEFILNNQSI